MKALSTAAVRCGARIAAMHHPLDSFSVLVPKRLSDQLIFFGVWQRRPEYRFHELSRRSVAVLLDVMHDHLWSHKEQIATRQAKISDAICLPTELTGVVSGERTEIQSLSAVAATCCELLETGYELSGNLPFGIGIGWMQPADSSDVVTGGNQRFPTHVGEKAHPLSSRTTELVGSVNGVGQYSTGR
jgi:hypothetical protein